MSDAALQAVCHYLRRLAATAEARSDGWMLQRYVQCEDASAFARLVERHGPMVLGVCRRVLGHTPDAEDAFQATFLTLARQARSIRDGDRLAAWLHRVAYRIARKAKASAAARAAGPLPALTATDDPAAKAAWNELWQILDEELNRLPERLRSPLTLCYLDGATQDEAARRLGWSLSTLKRRLEDARALLRRRLTNRGVAPLGLAATVLVPGGLRAAVSAQLLKAASALGASFGTTASVTPGVLALVQGGMSMSGCSLKSVLVVLTASIGLALGMASQSSDVKTPTPEKPQAAAVNRPAPQPSMNGGPRVDRFGDPLPDGALHRFGTVRFRHGGGIKDADLSPDGKLLVVCSEIGITLFEVETGKPRFRLRDTQLPKRVGGHPWTLSFSPEGKTIASVADNGTIRIWDSATGKEARRFGTPAPPLRAAAQGIPPQEAFADKIRYLDGGKTLLTSNRVGMVRLIDSESGEILREIRRFGKLVGHSRDEKTLIAVGALHELEVALYDTATGQVRQRFSGEGKVLLAADLTPDGKTLVAVNDASRLFLWDVATEKLIRTIQASVPSSSKESYLRTLAIAPDGKTLVAGTSLGKIHRWEIATGQELPALPGHAIPELAGYFGGNRVTGLRFTPDGKILISVGDDGLFRRWDLTNGKEIPAGEGYVHNLEATLSLDGQIAIVGDSTGLLEAWNTATGERLQSLRPFNLRLIALAFSPDGKTLASSRGDKEVTLLDTTTWREVRTLKEAKQSTCETLKFSPDGRSLLALSDYGGIRSWDVATGKEVWYQPLTSERLLARQLRILRRAASLARGGRRPHDTVAFSPNGKILVTGGWDDNLTFFDAHSGQERFVLPSESNRNTIEDIVFSPDGRILATAHHDGTVWVRDPDKGREMQRFQVCENPVWKIAFSPDGNWLLSVGGDDHVRLHEVFTGQPLLDLTGHDAWVSYVAFGAEGKTALSASGDLTALYWSLRPAKVPATKENPDALWEDLRSEQAATAYRAQWALLDDPGIAVELLGRKLPPAKSDTTRTAVLQLIADLDSRDFRARQEATKALTALAHAAEPFLREALANVKSAEQERRIEGLLTQLKQRPTTPDDWRILRSVQVLELAGTPEARQLLRAWSDGTPGMLLTERAKDALSRMR